MHEPSNTLEIQPLKKNETLAAFAHGILRQINEDPQREGLIRTPFRFQKAFHELTSGYRLTPEMAVGEGIFSSESRGLVCVRDIEFYSLCEHHMLPFWGKAAIAYYPDGKILGLSKLARILDVFARRLQVQERLTKEVADAVHSLIGARAAAVIIEAQHMCMMMRGVNKQSSTTRTEYMVGGDSLAEHERERLWKQLEK
jgi:GTP cyclohydrolase IA